MSSTNSTNLKKENFLVRLGESESTNIAVVGGKGASLGKLVREEFLTPSGFVVSTGAYAEFLSVNNLQIPVLNSLMI
jgi:pyruvate,water dikinase